MNREYHKWQSERLGRPMELLVFGHWGPPILAFPTSGGRFYDFENFQMIESVRDKIEAGAFQVFCVDSVDRESFYNRGLSPEARIGRHEQYERYLLEEVLPF